ncbi:NitT/TauT family transport system permease protein [Pedococcus cremeus]|uniref:NitT/TauT family transport system permease protein n=1 Tax=Pedococcus cremeus TaxID=587636 RepID=A0A1H9WE82_9MICO|nr:ABC transporter permease [Pedococcus cremeus]SES32101.1 NitT/TauT family transport system permease protein [Pedococcus cremeus]
MSTTLTDRRITEGPELPVQKRRRRPTLGRMLLPIGVVVGLILVWQLACSVFNIPTYIIPSPVEVWQSLSENWAMLMQNTWPTLIESVLGFALGNLVAILLAVLFVHWKLAERALMPVAVFIRTIPIVAVAPVLVIMFGQGYTPKILIAALISFFPTLVNMVKGLESVDKQSLELLRVLSASRNEVLWKVRMFASLPYLFASLKIAAGNSVIGAIVAEWIGSQEGLGYLIIQATYNFNTPLLYATMTVASIMAVLFFGLIGLIERLVVTWEADVKA